MFVILRPNENQLISDDMRARLKASYGLVFDGLPKRVRELIAVT